MTVNKTYRPSLVLNVKLRFDEALTVVTTPPPQSIDERADTPPVASAVGSFLGLGAGAALGSFFDATNNIVKSLNAATVEPLITKAAKSTAGSANTTFINNRVPKTCNVELPGYRQASTFEFTVDYKELPIDPRCLRSAAVEVHLGTVSATDFAAGMRGQRDGKGRLLSILDTRAPNGEPNADTLVMVGLVDAWSVEHSESHSIVTVKGRDLRSALIDMKLGVKPGVLNSILSQLDTSQPIDKVVEQVLSYHPAADLFAIETNPFEWPGYTLPSPLGSSVTARLNKGARGKSKGGFTGGKSSDGDMSFWDLITQLCYLVGAIPYFKGYALRIRPSRSIFDQLRAGFDPQIPTPFMGGQPRTVEGGEKISVRRLVYGCDVKSLKFEREFAGNSRPKTIRCVSVDPTSKQKGGNTIVEGRWPLATKSDKRTTAARTQHVAPSNQNAHEEILNIPVPNVKDPARLQEIAHSLWNEIGRNEMGGDCSTGRSLSSFGGDNSDPDILRLQPGDGVEFLADIQKGRPGASVGSTYIDYARMPFAAAVEEFKKRLGGNEDLARVIVATQRGIVLELQRFFRVATVKYAWGPQGIDCSFSFQNYLIVRYDVGDSVGTLPGAVKRTTVSRRNGADQ